MLGRYVVGLVRAALGFILLLVFTAIDALITLGLVAYQSSTARPYLVGDSWAAFAQRFNDRLFRLVLEKLN